MHPEGDIEQFQEHELLLWTSQLYGLLKSMRYIFEYLLVVTVPLSLASF